jgi:membrane protease YdiL (CAAX protease family)
LVFTEEPTAQQTSLPTEPADVAEQSRPEPYADNRIEPVAPIVTATTETSGPTIGRWHDWFNLLKAFLIWVVSIILLVVVQLIFTIPYFIYLWATSGPPKVEALATDKIVAFLSIIAVLPSHLLTFGVIWLMVTEGRKRPFWKTIKFEWPENIRPGIVIIACVVLSLALLSLGGLVTHYWGGTKTQIDLLVESSVPARLATAFVAVFTAPLVEELIYRGVLYSALERTLGKIIGVLVVSLLFAGVHVFQYIDNFAVIGVITLLSVTLTVVRAYTGKVLPSFIIHLVFNGIQSIVIALWPFFGWNGSN